MGTRGLGLIAPIAIPCIVGVFAIRGTAWAPRTLAVIATLVLLAFAGGGMIGSRGKGLTSVAFATILVLGLIVLIRFWRSSNIAAFIESRRTNTQQ